MPPVSTVSTLKNSWRRSKGIPSLSKRSSSMPFIDSRVTEVLTQQATYDKGITEADIYTAIADVLDPELDEPLVKLGFIDRVMVDGSVVTMIFRLTTYWCA